MIPPVTKFIALLDGNDIDAKNAAAAIQQAGGADIILAELLRNLSVAAGSAIIGKVGIDQTTPGTTNGVQINAALPAGTNALGSTKDGGTAFTTSLGVSGARITSADQSAAVASITDAPTSGQKIVIDDILFSSDTALRLDFSEETSGTILFSVYTSAGSSGQFTPRGKLKLATSDKKLQWRASAAGNIAVTPLYHSEA